MKRRTVGKLIGRTIGLGLGSVALYAAVFTNSDTVMKYFTKGGIFAALPIVTVFAFSFVHGAFASNLWSLLGIEATKKVAAPGGAEAAGAEKASPPAVAIECLIKAVDKTRHFLQPASSPSLPGRGRGPAAGIPLTSFQFIAAKPPQKRDYSEGGKHSCMTSPPPCNLST